MCPGGAARRQPKSIAIWVRCDAGGAERRLDARHARRCNIEMAQEAGEKNFFLFGLTAEQVADRRAWYNPQWHYERDAETRAALDPSAHTKSGT